MMIMKILMNTIIIVIVMIMMIMLICKPWNHAAQALFFGGKVALCTVSREQLLIHSQ